MSMVKATRQQMIEHGFVTGTLQGVPGSVSFRLTCYRPGAWLGRLTGVADMDKIAKPVLKGSLSGDQERTEVRYRVDAFGTALSEVVLLILGLLLVIAGVIVNVMHPMSMEGFGSFLWIMGAILLGFSFRIWLAIGSAILDEQYLTDWLQATLR